MRAAGIEGATSNPLTPPKPPAKRPGEWQHQEQPHATIAIGLVFDMFIALGLILLWHDIPTV
jgi:hypothetical protein